MCSVWVAATASRCDLPVADMNGSTALLVNTTCADGGTSTREPGFMHAISAAICRESPTTTDVLHPDVV